MIRKVIFSVIVLASAQGCANSSSNVNSDPVAPTLKQTYLHDKNGNPIIIGSSGDCIRGKSTLPSGQTSMCLGTLHEIVIVSPKEKVEEVAPTPVEVTPAPVVEVIDLNIYFDFDKNVLRLSEQMRLEKAVAQAKKANQIIKVSVDGHADSRGTDDYNYALSQRRINSVVNYLNLRGIEVNTTMAWGESQLIMNADGTENYQESRRSYIYIKVN